MNILLNWTIIHSAGFWRFPGLSLKALPWCWISAICLGVYDIREQGLAWPLEGKCVLNYEIIESFSPQNQTRHFLVDSGQLISSWGVTDGWFNWPLATDRRRYLCHLLNKQPLLWPKAKNKLKRKIINSIMHVELSYVLGSGTLKNWSFHVTKE